MNCVESTAASFEKFSSDDNFKTEMEEQINERNQEDIHERKEEERNERNQEEISERKEEENKERKEEAWVSKLGKVSGLDQPEGVYSIFFIWKHLIYNFFYELKSG